MRAVIQRVTRGSVSTEEKTIGRIQRGLVVLLAIKRGDGEAEALWLAHKIATLRIFDDDEGKFDRSLLDIGGEALVISQFTLYGNARRGRRPSFSEAAPPELAAPLIDHFCALLSKEGVSKISTGRFQARMLVEIYNDGPVTLILDTDLSRRGYLKD